MKKYTSLAAVILLGCVAAGCSHTVKLNYNAEAASRKAIAKIDSVNISLVVQDRRPEQLKNLIGKRYSAKDENIKSKEDLSTLFYNALKDQLTVDGHQVVDINTRPDLILRVYVKKCWVCLENRKGIAGIIDTEIEILQPGSNTIICSKPIGAASSRLDLNVVSAYSKTLEETLKEFVLNLTCDYQVVNILRKAKTAG